MEEYIKDNLRRLKEQINDSLEVSQIAAVLEEELNGFDASRLTVEERVEISKEILNELNDDQRKALCKDFIKEQIVDQRMKLSKWSIITAQSGMIDTGYVAQHLVSLCTKIPGQGMRGKGLDLVDGSEIKAANFVDALDKNGAKVPRWNFQQPSDDKLNIFLSFKFLYLVSLDYSENQNYRIRIWKVDTKKQLSLRKRYREWMELPTRNSENFQLFPPRSGTDETFARHGSKKKGSLPERRIYLENVPGAMKIFHAELINNEVSIKKFL